MDRNFLFSHTNLSYISIQKVDIIILKNDVNRWDTRRITLGYY